MRITDIYPTLEHQTTNTPNPAAPQSLKHACIARLCQAALLPLDVGNDLLRGIAAIPLASLSLVPFLGLNENLNETSNLLLFQSGLIFSHAFKRSLSILNPGAFKSSKDLIVEVNDHDGIIGAYVLHRLRSKPQIFKDSKDFYKKHILARLLVPTTRIFILAARVLDLGIAILAVPLAFISAGTIRNLNNLAYRSLLLPHAVQDIHRTVLLVLNPYRD